MDPQATLYRLLQAIDEGDREDVLLCLDALKGHVASQGFLPEVIYAFPSYRVYQTRKP